MVESHGRRGKKVLLSRKVICPLPTVIVPRAPWDQACTSFPEQMLHTVRKTLESLAAWDLLFLCLCFPIYKRGELQPASGTGVGGSGEFGKLIHGRHLAQGLAQEASLVSVS